MTLTAAILLVLSAVIHAGWNSFSKKGHPTLSFYMVANTCGAICMLPLLLSYGSAIGLVPLKVWCKAGFSGFFLACYMASLAGAYRTGDMSVAYPIARSFPALFVAAITMILGLGQRLSGGFLVAVVLIVLGSMVLPLHQFRRLDLRGRWNLSCALSLLAALATAGYTIVDHAAIADLQAISGRPFAAMDAVLIYIVLEAFSGSLWEIAWVLCSSSERLRFRAVMAGKKWAAAMTGVSIYLTYGLVLLSMNYVTNVSYVAVFRQLSIPMGAVFGMVFLKEPRPLPKLAGLVLIFLGSIMASVM